MHRNVLGAERRAVDNVITTGELSRRTKNVLYERGLTALAKKNPPPERRPAGALNQGRHDRSFAAGDGEAMVEHLAGSSAQL